MLKTMLKKGALLMLVLILIMVMYMMYFMVDMAYGNPYGNHQLSIDQIPQFLEIPLMHTHSYNADLGLPIMGSAVIDIDADGTEELFLGGGPGQKDQIFTYQEEGFVVSTEKYGLTKSTESATYGTAVVDTNRDGYDDLYVARNDGVYLYLNNSGVLIEQKLDLEFDESSVPLSLAVGDINKDNHPDLYVSAYLKPELIEGITIFNREDYGGQSLFFVNNGDGTFTDSTDVAGLRYLHNTFQASFIDLDLDGEQDLVVAHDTGVVKTWRNNGDMTFTDIPNPSSDVFAYPMGIAIGDYNNDGLTDLAFSNIGDMGPMTPLVRGDLRDDQVLNHYLMLWENKGDFVFEDVAKESKVQDYEFGWGLVLEDFNNDTLEDLVVAQNYISLPPHKVFRAPSRFLLQGDNGFATVEKDAGTTNRKFSIAPLYADFNNDGQLDLVYPNLGDNSRVFINQGNNTPYVGVVLPNETKNYGAEVTVISGETSYTKTLSVSEGLASDATHRLLFGLPGVESIDRIDVVLLNGSKVSLDNPQINSYVKIYE